MSDGPADDLPEQMRVRREKLDRLRAEGVDPYPVGFPRTTTIAELRAAYPDLRSRTTRPATGSGSTGRVMLRRIGGKLCFATLRDGTGDLQVMLSLDRLGEDVLAAWKHDVDLGDHVGVEGEVITSRRGELSVLADQLGDHRKACARCRTSTRGSPTPRRGSASATSTSSSTRGAADAARSGPPSCARCASRCTRGASSRSRRRCCRSIHGGATARPFTTHINAYDMRPLPAHRARALPQAAGRRRHREGLRDQPELPQRGRRLHPQPRVHDARGVRGLRRLQHDARC